MSYHEIKIEWVVLSSGWKTKELRLFDFNLVFDEEILFVLKCKTSVT